MVGQGVKVVKSGLWVNPLYPGMGCSPDGVVYEDNGRVGLIEIKCPSTLEKHHPSEACEKLTRKQKSAFCCKLKDDTLTLKHTHSYYWQIQIAISMLNGVILFCGHH